ncbi:RidA family protein [Paludibacter sp.]
MKKIIATPNAPAAIGPYSQAVEINGTLYLSGQIPINPQSGKIEENDIVGQTHQVFKNIIAILEAAGYTIDDIVSNRVYLTDINDFAKMNEVYKQYFVNNFPSRAAFAVKDLPLSSLIEIETVAVRSTTI